MSDIPEGFEVEGGGPVVAASAASDIPPGFEIDAAPKASVLSRTDSPIPAVVSPSFVKEVADFLPNTVSGVSHVVGRVAHDVVNPGDALSDVKAIGQGLYDAGKRAVENPTAAAQAASDYLKTHRFNTLVNLLTLPTGSEGITAAPLTATTKALGLADDKLLRPFLGMTTGTGNGAAVAQAAGLQGGKFGSAFWKQLMKSDPETIRNNGLTAIRNGRDQINDTFAANAAPWLKSTTPMPSAGNDIINAINEARQTLPSRGPTALSSGPHETLDDMAREVWATLGNTNGMPLPRDIHDLKLKLQPALQDMKPGSTGYRAVTSVLNSVRGALAKVPGYDETMSQFADPTNALNQAVSELSLGARAKRGTAVNALLSALRPDDGGGGLFASRAQSLNELSKYDPTLPYQIAGALMNPKIARGLWGRGVAIDSVLEALNKGLGLGEGAAGAAVGSGVGALAAGKLGAILTAIPGAGVALLGSSPRANALTRYGIGASVRGARKLGLTQKNIGLLGESARLAGQAGDNEDDEPLAFRGLLSRNLQ